MRPNIKYICEKFLIENGYDGFYNPGECACAMESAGGDGLMPCDCPHPYYCEAGYLVKCREGHEYDFMVVEDPAAKDCQEEDE